MVRERIKELVEFATTESPYRNATKGWLTDDVYINWGTSHEKATNQGDELANVSFYWKPVSQLALIIITVVFLAAIFVFSAVSFAHGRFQIPIEATKVVPATNQILYKDIEPKQIESKPSIEPVTSSEVALDVESEDELNSQSRSDFAAAALGGMKIKR